MIHWVGYECGPSQRDHIHLSNGPLMRNIAGAQVLLEYPAAPDVYT